MEKFSLKSVALKWYFFTCVATGALFGEYFNLFMKQLGFNPGQTGLTTLFGVPQLFVLLFLMFAEKLRARKTVTVFGTLGALVCSVLPLLSLLVPPLQPACYTKTTFGASIKAIQLGNGSAHLSYATNAIRHKKHFTWSKSLKTGQRIFSNSSVYTTASSPSAVKIYRTIPLSNSPETMHHNVLGNDSVRSRNSNSIPFSKTPLSQPYLTSMVTLSLQHVVLNSNGRIFAKYSKVKSRLSYSSIHHFLRLNNTPSIRLIARRSSLPSNHSSTSPGLTAKTHNSVPLLSVLFVLLTISRSLTQFFERMNFSLANVATITYIQGENKTNYGDYPMWSHIGCALSIPSVALFAWYIQINICGVTKYGYFMVFILGGVMFLLSMLSLPWFTFEYHERKTFSWSGVKTSVLNAHYILMFVILFYTGMCLAFQTYWEFWYLDELSASPLLIGGSVLVRRPILAMSMYMSSHCVRKIGDLNTICVALLLYACSFLALSFTRIAWLVIVIDTSQATAYGLNYCAFIMLFSKAASKENSSVIFGEYKP